jgi:hypothetical protein
VDSIPRRKFILDRVFSRIVFVAPKQISSLKDFVVAVNVVLATEPVKNTKATASGYAANVHG